MPLILEVQTYRHERPPQTLARRFGPAGGTVGRGQDSDLCLIDPDKYISRCHAKILFSAGDFYLCDVGSNPTLVNGRPLGTGKSVKLVEGDNLGIGEYTLRVSVEPERQAALTSVVASDWLDPLSGARVLETGNSPATDDPLGIGLFATASSLPDPLTGQFFVQQDKGYRGSESDHVAPELQPFPPAAPAPPAVGPGAIPDNWDPLASLLVPPRRQAEGAVPVAPLHTSRKPLPSDSDLFAGITFPAAAQTAPEDRTESIPARVSTPVTPPLIPDHPVSREAPTAPVSPEATPPPVSTPNSGSDVLASLLRGLGLSGLEVRGRSDQQIAELLGAMLNQAISGTMEVLRARAVTKQEVRVDATLIASRNNNPLKFFPDAQSALTQMITGQWAGYLSPERAIVEAFDDIKAHELAVIVGMRSALAGVLARFDPTLIEARLSEKTVLDKMFSGNRKAKLWDGMVDLYREISVEADSDFQRLFGEKFSEAYKEQVQRLKNSRL